MLEIAHLAKTFRAFGRPPVTALDDVSLTVPDGAAVGLVGESGSGKSTLLRCLMRLERPDSGSISFDGQDVLALRGRGLLEYRRRVQLVFQDPLSSLNPRMSVDAIIQEGMRIHGLVGDGATRERRVGELLEMVGLDPDHRRRRPASFSGGQRQRIAIARALSVDPAVLICDEPVSALDVSVQAQILNLLADMQRELGLSLLFVAHDLGVVRYLCPEMSVLRRGAIVEQATREEIFAHPREQYTKELIEALPTHERLRPAHAYDVPPSQLLEV